MCRLRNIPMRDYQESVTTKQTDTQTDGQTKWSLCVAMLRRRHKNWVGQNKIKNKIVLYVSVHMEYWMSEILHSIYNMMGFRRYQTIFQQWYFSDIWEVIFTCCHSGITKIQLFQYIRFSNVCRVYIFQLLSYGPLDGTDNSYIYLYILQ